MSDKMSQWKFQRNRNNANQMNRINESVCNEQVSFTPINKHYISQSAPTTAFKSRPLIERTPFPIYNNNKENNKNINNNMNSPAAYTSYYIPNTPIINNNKEVSPTILSQPEGTYSPIPKAKILSELNQSLSHLSIEQKQNSPFINKYGNNINIRPSEKRRNKIRNKIRNEIEKMDFELSKELNDNFKLLNPSPSTLLKPLNKLKITNNGNNYTPQKNKLNTLNNEKSVINNKQIVKSERKNGLCSDILWNSAHFILILLVLCLYWTVIDFQWS